MRYLLIVPLLLFSLLSFAQEKQIHSSFVKKLPDPQKTVHDFGRFLTTSDITTLDVELKDYLKRTSNAIVIVTLDSLTDPKTKKEYTVEEAARLYLNTWGIGDSVKNNGVLLLISRKPRRIAIEVGWGLMAVLNYPFCKGIIDSTMAPAFKNDNYFTGLKDAVTALENKVDDPVPPPQRVTKPLRTSHSHLYTLQSASSEDEPLGKDFFMIIVGLVGGLILIVIIAMLRKESDGYYDGEGYYRRERRRRDKQMIESLSGNSSRGSFSSSSFSSSSSSSRSSSLSSSSSSYGGGGSSGGGASGSW